MYTLGSKRDFCEQQSREDDGFSTFYENEIFNITMYLVNVIIVKSEYVFFLLWCKRVS